MRLIEGLPDVHVYERQISIKKVLDKVRSNKTRTASNEDFILFHTHLFLMRLYMPRK